MDFETDKYSLCTLIGILIIRKRTTNNKEYSERMDDLVTELIKEVLNNESCKSEKVYKELKEYYINSSIKELRNTVKEFKTN